MKIIAMCVAFGVFVPVYGFIDEDPGLYAEEFSIQAERQGTALDGLSAILEQAVAGDIKEKEGTLKGIREEFDGVYNKLAEWEKIPDEYTVCTAALKESAVKAGESVDALFVYMEIGDTSSTVKATMKFEEAFDAYCKSLDTYPYVMDTDI
jgi:hypothetical protein